MPLITHTVTLETFLPGAGLPLDGTWTLSVAATPPVFKDTTDHIVFAGRRELDTMGGLVTLELEETGQAGLLPVDGQWQLSFRSKDHKTTLGPFTFDVDGPMTLDNILDVTGNPPTTTLLAQVTAQATSAAASAAAAIAVGSTNDTIIAGRVNDSASATRAALDARVGSVNDRPLSALDPRLAFVPGGTNNAAAWVRLKNLMTSGGAEVYFPPGEWKTNINGVSVFQPIYDVAITGAGDSTRFTTDTVTTLGNLITPAATIKLQVRNVRASGTGTAGHQFINYNPASGTGKLLVEDVTVDGDWDLPIKVAGAGSCDLTAQRLKVDLTAGTGLMHSGGGGRVHASDCEFRNFGLAASNQHHAIYAYRRISLRVARCNFWTQLGIGYAVHNFGGTAVDPEYADVIDSYFGPSAGRALTNYAPMRVARSRLMATAADIIIRNDLALVDCQLAGAVTVGGDAVTGSIIQIRGGESTKAGSIFTDNVGGMVVEVDGHRFRGLTSTATAPFDGTQIGATTRSIKGASYGAASLRSSTTANRPSAAHYGPDGQWQDTTLGKRVFSNGTVWKDATGTTV